MANLKDQLEDFVDQIGLSSVVGQLSDICHEKAEYLQSNWQDSVSAKTWAKDAITLDKIASKLAN